jgi:hypothetical protein
MATRELKLLDPGAFSGDRYQFDDWLQACDIYLRGNRNAYTTDEERMWFVVSHMQKGEAADWVEQYIQSRTNTAANTPHAGHAAQVFVPETYETFRTQLKTAFQPVDEPASAHVKLQRLQQGNMPMEAFTSQFKNLVRRTQITDDRTIIDLFRKAIDRSIAYDIDTSTTPPTTPALWYEQARRRYDQLLKAQTLHPGMNRGIGSSQRPRPRQFNGPRRFQPQQNQQRNGFRGGQYTFRDPYAMQVDNMYYDDMYYPEEQDCGPEYTDYPADSYDEEYEGMYEETYEEPENDLATQLANIQLNAVFTPLERERYSKGLCFRCGKADHFARRCPMNPQRPQGLSRPGNPSLQRRPFQQFKGKAPIRKQLNPQAKKLQTLNVARTLNNMIAAEDDQQEVQASLSAFSDF